MRGSSSSPSNTNPDGLSTPDDDENSVTMIVESTCVLFLPSVTKMVKLYSGSCSYSETLQRR